MGIMYNGQLVSGKKEFVNTSSAAPTITIEPNSHYEFQTPLTALTISNYIKSNQETQIFFTAAAGFALVIPLQYFNKNAGITYNVNEPYEISIQNGIVRIG